MSAVHSQVGARRRGIGWLDLLLSFQRKSTVAENEEVFTRGRSTRV
jgi:hypothetical protein